MVSSVKREGKDIGLLKTRSLARKGMMLSFRLYQYIMGEKIFLLFFMLLNQILAYRNQRENYSLKYLNRDSTYISDGLLLTSEKQLNATIFYL